MATRTANVTARVEPEIKEQAEAVMERLGLPVSTAINMFYRQIIFCNGLPFRPSIPSSPPKALDEMTKEEFDAKMSRGIEQAIAGEGIPADEFFDSLKEEINN